MADVGATDPGRDKVIAPGRVTHEREVRTDSSNKSNDVNEPAVRRAQALADLSHALAEVTLDYSQLIDTVA
jgi:hypothetical protein